MDNKQFLAQLGVFALLGVNLGGYWLFWQNGTPAWNGDAQASWPANHDGVEEQEIKGASVKEMQKAEAKTPEKTSVAEIPQTIPISIPIPIAESSDAKIRERLASLKVQTTMEGVAQHLAGAARPSPWHLNMEAVGTQTQLIARLRYTSTERSPVEFKVLCDRLDMKAPDGVLQAVGNVKFVGAGMNGGCDRLTLPLTEARLQFEGKVEITLADQAVEGMSHRLRGDPITWEFPAALLVPESTAADLRPASFKTPAAALPPMLEAPR